MPPAFPKGLGKRGEAHRDRPGKQGPPHLTRTSEGTKGGGKFKSDPADEAFAPGNPKRGDPKGLPLHSQGMDPATQRHAFHQGPFLTSLPKPLVLY
jgi:hypothetical protein